jgi:hypothetical protein
MEKPAPEQAAEVGPRRQLTLPEELTDDVEGWRQALRKLARDMPQVR